jgi:acyl-CoA thioester hydrolase
MSGSPDALPPIGRPGLPRPRASLVWRRPLHPRISIVPEFVAGQPLVVHRETVRPEWIDYNGHMNVAYYVLAFDHAADALFDILGLDVDYRRRTQASTFALEGHVVYKREVAAGDPLRFEVQMLDFNGRFFHYINKMYHDGENWLASSCEWISCGIDLATRRPADLPPDIAARFQALHDAHRMLPRPPEAGRVIGIRRKAGAAA